MLTARSVTGPLGGEYGVPPPVRATRGRILPLQKRYRHREGPVFKHLVLAAVLCAPCLAFAGQAMSVDECSTVASNAAVGAADTVISPMHDGGGNALPAVNEPGAGRGGDDTDSRTTQTDSTAPHAANSAHGANDTTIRSHKGGGHGRAPWQSLLPGVMK